TPYRTWFESIAVDSIGLALSDPVEVDRAFAQRVKKTLTLLERFDRHGFDTRYPITVAELKAGELADGLILSEDWFVPVDGCHRLALLWLEGCEQLRLDEYRVDPNGTVRANTA